MCVENFKLSMALSFFILLNIQSTQSCSWCTEPIIGTDDCVPDGSDWTLARAIGASKGSWFRHTDHLNGTHLALDVNGNEFNIGFFEAAVPLWNQFLFVNGDCSSWLITSKFAAIGESYANANQAICASSISATPYTAKWYNRRGYPEHPEDPWISTLDHVDAIFAREILYGGNNYPFILAGTNVEPSGGAYVYIRNEIGELDANGCPAPTENPTNTPSTSPTNNPTTRYSTDAPSFFPSITERDVDGEVIEESPEDNTDMEITADTLNDESGNGGVSLGVLMVVIAIVFFCISILIIIAILRFKKDKTIKQNTANILQSISDIENKHDKGDKNGNGMKDEGNKDDDEMYKMVENKNDDGDEDMYNTIENITTTSDKGDGSTLQTQIDDQQLTDEGNV